jgi:hypothetical protein
LLLVHVERIEEDPNDYKKRLDEWRRLKSRKSSKMSAPRREAVAGNKENTTNAAMASSASDAVDSACQSDIQRQIERNVMETLRETQLCMYNECLVWSLCVAYNCQSTDRSWTTNTITALISPLLRQQQQALDSTYQSRLEKLENMLMQLSMTQQLPPALEVALAAPTTSDLASIVASKTVTARSRCKPQPEPQQRQTSSTSSSSCRSTTKALPPSRSTTSQPQRRVQLVDIEDSDQDDSDLVCTFDDFNDSDEEWQPSDNDCDDDDDGGLNNDDCDDDDDELTIKPVTSYAPRPMTAPLVTSTSASSLIEACIKQPAAKCVSVPSLAVPMPLLQQQQQQQLPKATSDMSVNKKPAKASTTSHHTTTTTKRILLPPVRVSTASTATTSSATASSATSVTRLQAEYFVGRARDSQASNPTEALRSFSIGMHTNLPISANVSTSAKLTPCTCRCTHHCQLCDWHPKSMSKCEPICRSSRISCGRSASPHHRLQASLSKRLPPNICKAKHASKHPMMRLCRDRLCESHAIQPRSCKI